MAPRSGDVLFAFSGSWVTHAHTIAAYIAFIGAFVVGVTLHYHKIVENEHFGYPVEWFPSVSATIGDRFPERAVFQLFIAVCSGPRFLLVLLWYCLTARPNSSLPKFVAGVGIFRTFTCGGWTYTTSTDNHDWHDIFMISYLVATLPWTLGCLALSPPNPRTVQFRKYLAGAFFGTLVPLVYFFIQHKVHKVPGAYTIYAFFEWSLVLLDVAFDAVTAIDFASIEIVIKDIKGISRGASGKKQDADSMLDTVKDKPVGQVFGGSFSWDAQLDALADVYLAFVFWSNLTGLGIIIWYFPLWYMGISGFEVAVMAPASAFLLGIPPLRRAIIRYMPFTLGTTAIGLLAYLITNKEARLGAISLAVWNGCLAWVAMWYAERSNPVKLEGRITAWSIGLIASSVAKFANWTNNPIWPIMHAENGGMNKTGIFLFVLAIARFAYKHNTREPPRAFEKPTGPSVLPAFGIAGLVFALHSLLSDSSTMISWVWEGFPIRGPIAVPHGAWTIFVMGAGLVFGVFRPQLARSWTAYGIGCVGAATLTLFKNWTGFYGALTLTFYLLAITPTLITNATRFAPGRTFFIGFFVYNIMVLFHVWVVAYAFVPGGPLVREHTDWVMITMMLLVGSGVFSALANESKNQRSSKAPANPAARKQRSYYIYILLVLQLISVSVAYLRFPSYDYKPYHPDSKSLTAGIWTIHFSLDNDMWSSERRMAQLLRETEVDIVGLLESDTQRIIMGNRDFTQYLAEDLGMYVDFGPGPNKHTWGAALLSKFPIINSTHHLLPSPVGELAPAIEATLDAYGELIDVFVFHSGQEEDPEDRRQQMMYLTELMAKSPRPSILLSYLVMKPHEGNYHTWISERSTMHDIDPTDMERWCEYILYKNVRKAAYARVSRSSITDTELQIAKFIIGQPEGTGEVIPEDHVPEDLRFPAQFRYPGTRGHFYHDIEPRYFA